MFLEFSIDVLLLKWQIDLVEDKLHEESIMITIDVNAKRSFD